MNDKINLKKEVIYTGTIPQCPYCEKPTLRTVGMLTSTAMYFPPLYNEEGVNINPDRNRITKSYNCQNCNHDFSISGNDVDGFSYN